MIYTNIWGRPYRVVGASPPVDLGATLWTVHLCRTPRVEQYRSKFKHRTFVPMFQWSDYIDMEYNGTDGCYIVFVCIVTMRCNEGGPT